MFTRQDAREYGRDYAQSELDALTVETARRVGVEYDTFMVREGLKASGFLDDFAEDDPSREELLDAAAYAAEIEWGDSILSLTSYLVADEEGFEWPGGSAPYWDHFEDTNEDEIDEWIADLEDTQRHAMRRGDSIVLDNVREELKNLEVARSVLERGGRVRVASDEDGFWWAYEVR